MRASRKIRALFGTLVAASAAGASADTLTVNRADYADRLQGMWLGEVIANWTGRMTEGTRDGTALGTYPFYTDASWGAPAETWNGYYGQPIGFTFFAPWKTDDDTDMEYAYVHMMTQTQNPMLSEQQLTSGWNTHMNQWLFFSNYTSRALINRGVSSASAGIAAANVYSHHIDAQLTTEIFGAVAPGRPDQGLRYGLAPMLITSRGHATHAAQYFNSLYSLAAAVPSNLTSAQKMQWLGAEARKYIPDTSKAADIIDFVTADFAANSDINDWESTRNKIHQRYQQNAASNGFVYRHWTESSVNLATGVMSLLYGNGDYRRTVQIATLSGWDSDNSTASLGGLFGLVNGRQYVVDQFQPGEIIDRNTMTPVPLTEDFYTTFTGLTNMPDYVPSVADVGDTFSMLANRMLPIVDAAVLQMGGTVNADNTWTIPLLDTADKLSLSPTQQITRRSANNMVRDAGGTVTATSSAVGQSSSDAQHLQLIADGFEHDFRGLEYVSAQKDGKWYSTLAPANTAATEQWLAVMYSTAVSTDTVRYIEGDNQSSGAGYFASLQLELLVNGNWITAPAGTALDEPLDANSPFQTIDFQLPYALEVTGVRLVGTSGAGNFAISASELDAFLTPGERTYYWDTDGTIAGPGGGAPSGNWNGLAPNFNTSAAGTAGHFSAAPTATDTVVFGAAGSYAINVSGSRTVVAMKFAAGDVTLSGGTVSAGSYDVSAGASGTISSAVAGGVTKTGGGTLTITSNNTYTGGTNVVGGTLVVNRMHENNAAEISAGATLRVAESTPGLPGHPAGDDAAVSRPSSLSIAPGGTLDLANNDLIIDYSVASPIADVEDMIRSGYNNGTWNGTGITSSTAALESSVYTLGVIDNATEGIAPFTTFSGQAVDTTTVLVKFVHRSDLNMDGVVSFSDSVRFNGNFAEGVPTRWVFGDLNYNGVSDFGDSVLFNGGYDEALASLPEPGGLSVFGLLGLALARRRRR